MPDKPAPAERDPRWERVLHRDVGADGSFVYGVRTTGVYCRPSCPSRRAKPANITFFDTPAEAEASGFRACLRCHPNGRSPAQANLDLIAAACRLIEGSARIPKLADLAARVGISPYHLHRQFKAVTGLTPRAWGAAQRVRRLQDELAKPGSSVTHAVLNAGFNSSSGPYRRPGDTLGMTPTAFRNGGKDTTIRFAVGQCSLGAVLVARSNRGICAITLDEDPGKLVRDLQDRFPHADLVGGDADFEELVSRVVGFVEAPGTGLDLPLDIRGTAFQERVWQALRQVPAGQTVSYAELARRIGDPGSARAVARACNANAIAVAIPCHRVVRTDGALSGYRWGVDRKRALLDREARQDAGRSDCPVIAAQEST